MKGSTTMLHFTHDAISTTLEMDQNIQYQISVLYADCDLSTTQLAQLTTEMALLFYKWETILASN